MRYAWDGVRRRPARSAATALGVGLATALVVMLLALAAGISSSAAELAESSGVDLLATSANTSLTGGSFPPVASAHELPSRIVARDPNVASASPWLVADLVFGNQSLYAAVNASPNGAAVPRSWGPTGSGVVGWIPDQNRGIVIPSLSAGAGFTLPGDPHYANGSYSGPYTRALVIDQGLAAVLHVHVGALLWSSPRPPIGPAELAPWYANATPFRVVGICGPYWLVPSALLAYGYLSEVQSVLGGVPLSQDTASLVLIHLKEAGSAARDQAMLSAAFPALTVFSVANILGAVANVVEIYRTFGTLIGATGVGVATLFTATVLLMSVDDRSREIALLRALGFGPGRLAREVASEGILLAGIGLAIGAPLGWGGSVALNGFLAGLLPGLPVGFSFISFDMGVIALTLAVVLLIGLLASALPIARALGLPVAEELRAP